MVAIGTFILVFLGLIGQTSSAQTGPNQEGPLRCGTEEYSKELAKNDATFAKFYYSQPTVEQKSSGNEGVGGIDIVIPVVVHVLYNEPSQNISIEQIESQIDRLNTDFAGTNANIGNVPEEFLPFVAYDTGIRFCLADTDPFGNSFDGVQRISTNKAEFSMNSNEAKFEGTGGTPSWPPCDYLNVWVVPKIVNAGGQEVLGYTQLPGGPAATEGVVIRHRYMGDNVGTAAQGQAPNINNFYKGRTLVHEIGHYLGLRHIWGDDSGTCGGSDLVLDTPNQSGSSAGCVTSGNSCGSNDMVMNYMDYTYDECMMMFSQGQKERMMEILTNEPSRSCLFSAQASSCGKTCFANVSDVVPPQQLAVCNRGTSGAFQICGNGPFYENLLLVVEPVNSTIVAISDSSKIDFTNLASGDYEIYPISYKNDFNVSSLIEVGTTNINLLTASLDAQGQCYDARKTATLKHAESLDIEVSLDCQQDAFGFFLGDAVLDVNIIGGSGNFYFVGPGNGDRLEHETERFVRVQDSAGCFVQEFVQVDCPPFDYAAFGFNFLENQPNLAMSNEFKVQFNSPSDLPVFVKAFNLAGQLLVDEEMETREGANVIDLNTSAWTPGIYIISLDNRNSRIQMKVLRRRN